MYKNVFIKYDYEQYTVRFFSLDNDNIELFASNEYNTKEYTIIIHVDASDMDALVKYLMNIENIISIFEYADEFSLQHYNYSKVYGLKTKQCEDYLEKRYKLKSKAQRDD